QPLHGIGTTDADAFGKDWQQDFLQVVSALTFLLDQLRMRGTARQRLSGQHTRAGKQVEYALVLQLELQPVEQRFAHAVAGRAQVAVLVGERQLAAAMLAADDAHGALAGGHGCPAASLSASVTTLASVSVSVSVSASV